MLAPISSDATARTRRGCRALETRFGHLEGTGRNQTGRRELPGAARGRHTSRRGDTSARPSRFREPKLAAKISVYNLSHYAPFSLRGAPTSRMGMTTVWRPRVRIDVPDVGDAENTDTSREELTKKGTKRKIAPMHHGPCEHGVKHRSNCKVCSACPHGRRRLSARSAVGQQSASTVVSASCKECGGSQICEHGRGALSARSAVGHQSASTVVCALSARSAVGINLRARSSSALSARSAVGHQSASTVVGALSARSAVGHAICEHGRRRSRCKECGGVESASTVVCALGARSAVGRESASTVGGAIDARIVLD